MDELKNIPSELDGASVLLIARLNENIVSSGTVRHRAEGISTPGPVTLAITRYKNGPGYYLFCCDEDWAVLNDTLHDTVSAAKAHAESEFCGIQRQWFTHPVFTERARTLLKARTQWTTTGDAEFPYRLSQEGVEWSIRVNDFPEYANVYSLLASGHFVCDLQSLPKTWQLPETPPVLSTEYVTECPLCSRIAGWNGSSYRGQNNWLYLEMDCPHCGNKFDSYDHEHQQRLERDGHRESR